MNETFDGFLSFVTVYGARVIAAAVAGAIIGLEGEMYEKPAGLRTNILITLGSALLSIISVVAAQQFGGEATRIAAQIVTGIGFIGAGVIVRYKFHVQGITTASTIYVNSAIGITIGFGYIFSGVGVSLLVFLILILLRPFDVVIDRSKYIAQLRTKDELRQQRRRAASRYRSADLDENDLL
jgi:putative Mg2+ transporter-C (MgtC) family protein